MDVNVENFLSDIVSKEISFVKENLIVYGTFGFYKGSVECLHRIIERCLSINSTSCVTTEGHTRAKGHKRYKNEDTRQISTFIK